MPDQPASLAAALVAFQADLPRIGKGAEGHHGRYADLPDVSKALLPRLASLGLYFTCAPGMEDGVFGLRYRLEHAEDRMAQVTGFYPLPNGTPQTIGGAITYARRYALLAVTGVAPDEDDDDAQAAEAEARALQRKAPETDRHGAATFAEQTRMVTGPVPGVKRSNGTPASDPFYDPPVPEPDELLAKGRRAMFAGFRDLDIIGEEAQRAFLGEVLGRPVQSRGELNLSELTAVNVMLRRRKEGARHE